MIMKKQTKRLANFVPELSFINKEYKFSTHIRYIVGKKGKVWEPSVLSRDFLKIGDLKLPLTKQSLYRIDTGYEDGEVSSMSLEFGAKGYNYSIFKSNNCSARIRASKQNKTTYFLYSGFVNKIQPQQGRL